ncbi:MAG: hypothetical protein CMH57_12130 [Myxococcales bacterium]|nr:hypothetical protein [Myxococcales bacterium]
MDKQATQTHQDSTHVTTSEGDSGGVEVSTTEAVFTEYINVLNQALGENRGSFPYDQLIRLGDTLIGDKRIGVGVFKEDADNPHDWFMVQFEDGTFELMKHGKSDPDLIWKTQSSYIEDVVQNSSEYIEQPSRIDLGWLKQAVGMA